MKRIILSAFLLPLVLIARASAVIERFEVTPGDIHGGFIVKKIWLERYELPEITLSDITCGDSVVMSPGMCSRPAQIYRLTLGSERKRPFAVFWVPAYTTSYSGICRPVTGFTVNYQVAGAGSGTSAAKATTSAASVLSTGTWYKIALTAAGFHKIDNTLIAGIGLDPRKVRPENIRVFGNGGRMLSEDNAQSRPDDLRESAVLVNGNGDDSFDDGESVIFYALGTVGWDKDSVNQRFVHQNNLYTDTAYYFISCDNGPGRSVAVQPQLPAGNVDVTTYNYYDIWEKDLVNPPATGKQWYGEQFNSQANMSRRFSFDAGAPVTCAFCKVAFASTSAAGACSYEVKVNGTSVGTGSFPTPTSTGKLMNIAAVSGTGACGAQKIDIDITFTAPDPGSYGYLDYVEINARRPLTLTSAQLSFRDWQSVGAGNIANFIVGGAGNDIRVMDVCDPNNPLLMSGSLSGGNYTFTQEAGQLHEFVAVNGSSLPVPRFCGAVPNQNLHGMPQADLIIVTHPSFLKPAQDLAEYHRQADGMRVNVATTSEIYNEFSSGGQDLSAVRDFVRMFYKRAGKDSQQMPRYLLLFGGGSYDYKDRLPANHNFVPVFESANSTEDDLSFSSDDFYGFLDDHENIEDNTALNVLDIGIGRLPVRNATDAADLVGKIKSYNSPLALGPWRIKTTIVADNGCNDPAGRFLPQAENMASVVTDAAGGLYNHGKVYLDAIPVISTPAGARSPIASTSINNQVNTGTFWVNYIGHGNPSVWAGERILTQDDYGSWNNWNKLPFMVTGTCDFGQFDQPQFVSAGEQLVLRKEGGVIVNLTTTKAVYSNFNDALNSKFLRALFGKQSLGGGGWKTFSDAASIGKNETFITSTNAAEIANFRKFVLLGDPALQPAFPKYVVQVDSVTDEYTKVRTDTVSALGAYSVKGRITDAGGITLNGFNGFVYTSFFDKARTVQSITGCNEQYQVRDNLIYKGKASVSNGTFSFAFIVPKDIAYNTGTGKISTYADDGHTDGAGADSTLSVGGFSDHPVTNTTPPVVVPFINDSLFRNGGITGANTSLYVIFSSETGINISGSSIGHDIKAVLDGDRDNVYILNDYYETVPDTYKKGYASLPLSGLSNGRHSFTVQAWDVNNNPGEGTVDFIVVDGSLFTVQQLMNYPNPFAGQTTFVFEHNHPDEPLDINIVICNTAGAIVKDIRQAIAAAGSRTAEVSWDGTGNDGSRLPSGVYIYRLQIATAAGMVASAFQKLVIAR